MLALAQTAQKFGQRPSKLLGIGENALALDFDITCSYRLLLFDLECNNHEMAAINGEEMPVGKITKDTLRW